MTTPLEQTRGACLPAESLAVLAGLRRDPGVEVVIVAGLAWVRWEPGHDACRRLLAVPGVELFDLRDELWYRRGHHLPAFGLPLDSTDRWPLDRALTPLPVQPLMPDGPPPVGTRLQLVRDDHHRAASAVSCSAVDLMAWADGAPSARIAALSAARVGEQVLIRGGRLPHFSRGERFWGARILIPMGFRPEPMLSESALVSALDLVENDLALLDFGGAEILPQDSFRTLSRAAVRMLAEEARS